MAQIAIAALLFVGALLFPFAGGNDTRMSLRDTFAS